MICGYLFVYVFVPLRSFEFTLFEDCQPYIRKMIKICGIVVVVV